MARKPTLSGSEFPSSRSPFRQIHEPPRGGPVADNLESKFLSYIGLTNEPASELAQAVDVLLPTQAVEPPRGSYAIAPRICQLAALDALFNRLGHFPK